MSARAAHSTSESTPLPASAPVETWGWHVPGSEPSGRGWTGDPQGPARLRVREQPHHNLVFTFIDLYSLSAKKAGLFLMLRTGNREESEYCQELPKAPVLQPR